MNNETNLNNNNIRILTGDRPTGRLHLGHYVGSLKKRLEYQERGAEIFIIIADYHTLTTKTSKEHLAAVKDSTKQLVLDYLSVGIDPAKTTIYLQSLVSQVAELNLLFGMFVSINRLKKVPTLKEKVTESGKESVGEASFGLLGYPVLQAADILMVKANLVPVGRDQESHLEVTREIAKRFNNVYSCNVFPEPQALVQGDLLPGIDGNPKMGKSLGNAIYLSDDSITVKRKVMSMFTDPKRLHANDPGTVDGNPVFIYHELFNTDKQEVIDLANRYTQGKVGDVEVKEKLYLAIEKFLGPIREKRAYFEAQKDLPKEIMQLGAQKASAEAAKTLAEVKSAMGMISN